MDEKSLLARDQVLDEIKARRRHNHVVECHELEAGRGLRFARLARHADFLDDVELAAVVRAIVHGFTRSLKSTPHSPGVSRMTSFPASSQRCAHCSAAS